MAAYVKFQVKSTGQWLNIFNGGATPSQFACQGYQADTDNFFWTIVNSSVPGWSLIQVNSSNQYLNITGGGGVNGAAASQNPLPNPGGTPPDNFLWQIEAPDNSGWSLIKVKSSGQYLNVLGNRTDNGAPVGQGNTPTTPNFLWMKYVGDPKTVVVTMNILDCASIYNLPDGKSLSDDQANRCLSMQDDNSGQKENPNQSSFETILNPGSKITWRPIINPGGVNSAYSVAITAITFEQGSGTDVIRSVTSSGDGSLTAQIALNAIHPDSGDNEAYSITFTLRDGTGTIKTYTFDPKIKINPST